MDPFELYTDTESMIGHYRKILKMFMGVIALELICFLVEVTGGVTGTRIAWGIRCADRCFNSGLRQSGVQDAESDQQARGGEKRDELNSFASRKESFRPISLAMKPTRSAAMMVPSRTPSSRPAKMSESTVAITVRDTSKATLLCRIRSSTWKRRRGRKIHPAAWLHLPGLRYTRRIPGSDSRSEDRSDWKYSRAV